MTSSNPSTFNRAVNPPVRGCWGCDLNLHRAVQENNIVDHPIAIRVMLSLEVLGEEVCQHYLSTDVTLHAAAIPLVDGVKTKHCRIANCRR